MSQIFTASAIGYTPMDARVSKRAGSRHHCRAGQAKQPTSDTSKERRCAHKRNALVGEYLGGLTISAEIFLLNSYETPNLPCPSNPKSLGRKNRFSKIRSNMR
eukprot:518286-Amphidinium_carterae.1